MRILTVTHFYESHGGGIERVAGRLCRQFTTLGAMPVWAASDGDTAPGDMATAPMPCINPTERLTGLPMPIPGLKGIRTLAREVRQSDAVIVHDALYVTSILALLIARMRRKRVVLIQHIAGIPFSSPLLRSIDKAANWLVTRPMLRAADERVFISDTVRRELLGRDASQSSELLFNGVDGKIFHPAQGDAPVPEAVGSIAEDNERRLLFVGRYVEKKGLSILRALAASRPDLTFYLVGSGPIRPTGWGLPNVHDLGPQAQDDVAQLYRWADLLILPSVGEGYPLVIQEAMACGLPVICGSPSELADPDAARWLRGIRIDLAHPEESAKRCSDAIDDLDPTPAERVEMARYAHSRYDWRSMAEKLIELARA